MNITKTVIQYRHQRTLIIIIIMSFVVPRLQ